MSGEAQSNDGKLADSGEFSLEPAAPSAERRSSTGYRHPYSYYTKIYEKSERSIKGWAGIGRDANPPELPPLDEPGEMERWWLKHMTNRPPAILRELAARARGAAPASVPPPVEAGAKIEKLAGEAPGKNFSISAPTNSADSAEAVAHGFEAALERVRQGEARTADLHARLTEAALLANDPEEMRRLSSEARSVASQLKEFRDQLRTYEEKAPTILANAGRSWVTDDVVVAWQAGHAVVASGLRSLYRRLRPELRACRSVEEEDNLWQSAIDELFVELRSSKFASLPTGES